MKIRINVFIFSLMMLLVFTNSNRMLGLSDYFIFPITFILITLFYFFINKKKLFLDDTFYALFVLLISFFVSSLVTGFHLDRGYLLSYILCILLAIFVLIQDYNIKEIRFLISSYIISAIIIAVMILSFKVEYGYIGSARYSIKFLNNDIIEVNYLAAYLVGPAFFSIIRFIGTRKSIKRLLYMFSTIVICTGIFMTSSRAAFIGLVLCIGFIFLDCGLNIVKNKLRYSVILIMLLFFGTVVLMTIIPSEVVSRLLMKSYLDSSNMQRILLWRKALESIFNSPTSFILGYGAIPTSDILLNIADFKGDAHNTFLSFWLQTGILGLFSILYIFLKALLRSIRLRAVAILGLLLYLIFISIILAAGLSLCFWFNLLLSLIILKQYSSEKLSTKYKSIINYIC